MKSVVRPIVVLSLGACAALTSIAPSAGACGGEWYPIVQIDPRIRGVDRAEDALDAEHTLAAAGSVIRMIPHIRQLDPTKTKLIQRAHRVLAIATARFDGALPISLEVPWYAQGKWLGKTDADRTSNLQWAAKTLRAVAAARHDDPAARTELAEALSRLESTRDEARGILEELAKKDLITSPEGYVALARLRGTAGDDAGRRAALDRCRSMAHVGAALCGGATSATT